MKKSIAGLTVAIALSLTSAMPTYAKKMEPLTAFVLGVIVTDAIKHDQQVHQQVQQQVRPKPRPRALQPYDAICVDRKLIPAKRVWIAKHRTDKYIIGGHYRTRVAHYKNVRYHCTQWR